GFLRAPAGAQAVRVSGIAAQHPHRGVQRPVGRRLLHRGPAAAADADRAAGGARARAGARRPPGRRVLLVVRRARVPRRVLPADRGAAAHHRPVRPRVLRGHRRRAAHRRPDGAGERAAQDRRGHHRAAPAAARDAGRRQPPDDRPPVPGRRGRRHAEHPPADQRAGPPPGGAVRRTAPGVTYPGSAAVGELQGEVEVLALEQAHHRLQVVLALGGDAQLLALHLGLDALGALVPDDLGHLLGVVLGDALLQGDRDAVLLAGRLGVRRVEVLEGDPALDELLLEHVEYGVRPFLTVGPDLHAVLARPGDGRSHAAEVEAGADLLGGLVKRVVGFLPVDL